MIVSVVWRNRRSAFGDECPTLTVATNVSVLHRCQARVCSSGVTTFKEVPSQVPCLRFAETKTEPRPVTRGGRICQWTRSTGHTYDMAAELL